MSIRYTLLKKAVRIVNLRKHFSGTKEDFIADAKKENQKAVFALPKDSLYHYEMRRIGAYDCMVMKHGETTGETALLMIYGGGFIKEPTDLQINVGKELGKRTGRDIWIPHYPLCPEHNCLDAYRAVLDAYGEMVRVYGAENIKITGFSSGGAIGIGIFFLNNESDSPLPVPASMVLSSPGTCPGTPETLKKMDVLDKTDVMIPKSYMLTMAEVMRMDGDFPDYYIRLGTGDFHNFPETHIFYGGDELLSAVAGEFRDGFARAGGNCTISIRPGMFHCYQSLYKILPESKEGFEEIVKLLK